MVVFRTAAMVAPTVDTAMRVRGMGGTATVVTVTPARLVAMLLTVALDGSRDDYEYSDKHNACHDQDVHGVITRKRRSACGGGHCATTTGRVYFCDTHMSPE